MPKIAGLKALDTMAKACLYTDGTRMDEGTTAVTITDSGYLGRYATVMDAEMLAVAMGWELGDV